MNRKCKKCNKVKPLAEFYKTGKYFRYICKKCENQEQIVWKRKKTRENKLKAVKMLGGKCVRCGYDKCIIALEFHHLKDKEFSPSKLFEKRPNWNFVKKEIKKCELLCANCHRETHYK